MCYTLHIEMPKFGGATCHTSYSFPKNAWYLLMKLVVLQRTRLENLGTLFEVNKPFAIGSLLVGKECLQSLQYSWMDYLVWNYWNI